MSPDPEAELPSEEEQIAKLKELGFSDHEIEQILESFGLYDDSLCGYSERPRQPTVDEPSVILAPHSLNPEEKKRIGYPLSADEKEILRRRLKRTEQRLREDPPVSQ